MSNLKDNMPYTTPFKLKKTILFLQLLILVSSKLFATNTTRTFFLEDKTPIIRGVSIESPGSNMSGYVGCKIMLTGINFIEVTAVLVNKIPVSNLNYTVLNENTIMFTAIAATGFIEIITKSNGGAFYGSVYTNLGYITANPGNWNQDSTWLNNKVPPNMQDTSVTIAHEVKAATGILNVGSVTINKAGELTLSAVLELYGSFVNKGSFNVEGAFRMHEKSTFSGDSPAYTYSSVLEYTGYKGDVKEEWTGNGLYAGAGTPSSVILSNGAEIRIQTGKFSLESGITIGDKCTFTLDSSDITIGGNWNKSESAIFNPGLGGIIFRGSDKQEILGSNVFTNITINNAKGVSFVGSTNISGTLNFILGKIILGENDLSMQAGATIKGYNNRRYIVTAKKGKLWQNVLKDIVYPIGNTSFNPVTFTSASLGSYGVRVIDSIPSAFNKDKMINRMWVVSGLPESKKLNISAQYNRGDKGNSFDAANPVMGFYGNGWNTNKALLTETDGNITASTENLEMAGEQYLLIGNPADIKVNAEPIPVAPVKEKEVVPNPEIPFNVVIRPNPFINETKILINSPDSEKTVKIYDAEGKLILTETLQGAGLKTIMVGKDFPTGVYTALITTNNNRKTVRIIKR